MGSESGECVVGVCGWECVGENVWVGVCGRVGGKRRWAGEGGKGVERCCPISLVDSAASLRVCESASTIRPGNQGRYQALELRRIDTG